MIKNIFFYLTAFITLCYDVWHLLVIMFNTIEKKIPDIIDHNYYSSYLDDSFRFSIASLVVMFPVYVGVSWYINRQIENGQMEADSKIRHAMIWATLLISIMSIAGSLISTIYNYLGGELSARLGYKILAVAIVSAMVAAYYYYLLNRNYTDASNKRTSIIIAVSSIVIVFAISAYCISVVGSPATARARKLDEKSIKNLTLIGETLSGKFINDGKIPTTIDDAIKINNLDPNTGLPYPYRVISQDVNSATFELCPVFASDYGLDSGMHTTRFYSNTDNVTHDHDVSVSHGKGKVCYQTTIKKNKDNLSPAMIN